MLDVTANKLIETLMFLFEFAFFLGHSLECQFHLCHIAELHDNHPFWHICDAAEPHLATCDPLRQHAIFFDEMIKESPHTCYPIDIGDIAFFVCPDSVQIAHVIGPSNSNPSISCL